MLSQSWIGEHNYAGGTPNADFEQEMGLPNNFGEPGFPEITGNFSQFGGTQFPNLRSVTDTTYNADENHWPKLSEGTNCCSEAGTASSTSDRSPTRSSDAFQFGNYATALLNAPPLHSFSCHRHYEYRQCERRHVPWAQPTPTATTSNLRTSTSTTWSLTSYIQDNYRARPYLTFIIGLRFEALPAM